MSAFDSVTGRLDTTNESIFETDDVLVENTQTEKQKEKGLKSKRISQPVRRQKYNVCVTGRQNGKKETLRAIFAPVMSLHSKCSLV